MEFRNCPHCGSLMEVEDVDGRMRSYPKVGVQCTGCPINFLMAYDDMRSNGRENKLQSVQAIWNRLPEEGPPPRPLPKGEFDW